VAGVQKKCRSVRLQPAFRFISKKVVQGLGSLTFTPNFHFATGPKFGSQFEFFKVFGSAAGVSVRLLRNRSILPGAWLGVKEEFTGQMCKDEFGLVEHNDKHGARGTHKHSEHTVVPRHPSTPVEV